MDEFNCYLGGNIEPDLGNWPPASIVATAAFFDALHVTRTHDVLCPAKRTSIIQYSPGPNEHMDTV